MHAWQKFGLLGEDPVLQFVNTVDDVGKSRSDDGISDWASLVDWAETGGVLSAGEASALRGHRFGVAVEAELRAIQDLREATWRVLRPDRVDESPQRSAEEVVARAVRWSVDRSEFRSYEGDFRWLPVRGGAGLHLPQIRLGLEVERFLRSEERRHVKECGRCTALFLDRGRGRSRVWCRMSTCGNRAKVERFRAKQRH